MRFRSWVIAALLALVGPLGALAQSTVSSGQVAVSASSGNVTAAASTATLAAPGPGNPPWAVTGVEINGNYATASSIVVCTITGLAGGVTLTIDVPVGPIASVGGSSMTPFIQAWNPALSADPATAVVFSCPSFGTGATNSSINIHAIMIQ